MSFECSSAEYYDLPIIQTWQPCTMSNNEVERPRTQQDPVVQQRARANSQVLTPQPRRSNPPRTQKTLKAKAITCLKWSPLLLIAGVCAVYFILAFILFCELCFCFYISMGDYELVEYETIVYQSALITVKGPIVVHCSAGIGRTGSVVMLEYVMDQLLSGQTIEDSDKILIKIREQRNNSIQTDQQYLFVHQVLLNYFEKKSLFMEANLKEAHAQFTEQYKKLTT